jgi:hypothetical protein
MAGFDGTYEVQGNKYVVHVEDSWNRSRKGIDQTREFKISGKQLTVTFTAKSPMTGQECLVTVTSERVE